MKKLIEFEINDEDPDLGFEMETESTEFEIDMENVVKEVLKEEKDPTVPDHVKKITQEDINNWNDKPEPYNLPIASKTTLGGIKIGSNLHVEEDGTVNVNFNKETDPTVPDHVKKITQEDINKWNNETDPTVPNHVKSITQEDIDNWNDKFSEDYKDLKNKPKINGTELSDNITSSDLNMYTKDEVNSLIDNISETIGDVESILETLTTGSGTGTESGSGGGDFEFE